MCLIKIKSEAVIKIMSSNCLSDIVCKMECRRLSRELFYCPMGGFGDLNQLLSFELRIMA